MRFILSFSGREYSFTTISDAEKAQDVMRDLNPDIYTSIRKVAGPLCNWIPDTGDMFALQFMVDGNNKIPAAELARMKSGSGLKEAKDWVEANF